MRITLPVALGSNRPPRVEVVVPCYNYGEYLPSCVHSILTDQPGLELRVTVVDDASPDGSGQIADALADSDARIRVLHNRENLGMVGTFNRGIQQVDSDYMLLISADDMVAPGALTRAAALMDAHPSVGLVYGHAQKFVDAPSASRAMPLVTWTTWRGSEWIRMQLRRSWSNISSPEAVVRTSVQHAVGPYDPELRHTLDVEMWLRIAAVSDVGHINGVDQAYYRRQPASYSAKFGIHQDIEERWRAYAQFLDRWDSTEQAARLRPRVRRNLAREASALALAIVEHGGEREVSERALLLAERIDPDADNTQPSWADARTRLDGVPDRSISAQLRLMRRRAARWTRFSRWRRARYFG